MLKTKNSHSFKDYAINHDPYLTTRNTQGIKRGQKEHIEIFSPLTAQWFSQFLPVDRAALCAELHGDYKLPSLQVAKQTGWFQDIVKNTLPADQETIEENYQEAVDRARAAYPEFFGEQ